MSFDHDVCAPQRELSIRHNEFVIGVPVAQFGAVTNDGYALCRQYLRQVDGETDIPLGCFRLSGVMTGEEGFEEDGGVERVLIGACLPRIAHNDVLVRCFEGQGSGFTGFVNVLPFAYADGVFILNTSCEIANGNVRLPEIRSLAV